MHFATLFIVLYETNGRCFVEYFIGTLYKVLVGDSPPFLAEGKREHIFWKTGELSRATQNHGAAEICVPLVSRRL
jgi:hypothetical protein